MIRSPARMLSSSAMPGPDVAAVDAVPLVPEPLHDLVERGSSPLDPETRASRRRREAEPGQRRDDDVERVLGASAVRFGVDERPDHPRELDERARVAVGHQQRRRVRHGRADVDEVIQLAVDRGRELRELVQAVLLGRPVEVVRPAIGEPAGVRRRRAATPVGDDIRRPARVGEAGLEVAHVGLGDVDGERGDLHGTVLRRWTGMGPSKRNRAPMY